MRMWCVTKKVVSSHVLIISRLNYLLKTYYFLLLIENKGLTKIVSLTGNDLETSRLLYSAMFCTNHKNAFLICKSSVFLPYCQSYSSEK